MKYSILTAAKNEAAYIGRTLKSVTGQTSTPAEWIIVNDGSTDATSDLIEQYVPNHPWIKLVTLTDFRPDLTTTGGRVGHILNVAKNKLQPETDFVVKLDADVEFDPDFFYRLNEEFNRDPELGVASGQLIFEGKPMKLIKGETKGAVMMIRIEVFRRIGGFFESKGRGEDTLLSVAARALGWKTDNFPIPYHHLKPEGVRHAALKQSYTTGYYKGSIPYRLDYFLLTQLKHVMRKPIIAGTLFQLAGYFVSRYVERYRPFPGYVTKQLQKEQKDRIWSRR